MTTPHVRILGIVGGALLLLLAGCTTEAVDPGPGDPIVSDFEVGGDRPAQVRVPVGFDPEEPRPLLVALHAFRGSGSQLESYLRLGVVAIEHDMLFVAPNGTLDGAGQRYWNSNGCCFQHATGVDDVAYLMSLIDEIAAKVAVDPQRIYLFGHSNGGFMAYRLACEHADRVAAVVSLAGNTAPDSRCEPSEAVHVLQIHGTADEAVPYDGIRGAPYYPPAPDGVARWAAYDGCDTVAETSAARLDLVIGVDAETAVTEYSNGCRLGGSAALWTLDGAGHIPSFRSETAEAIIGFLDAHAKP